MRPIDIFLRSEKGGYSSGTSVSPLIMEVTPRVISHNVYRSDEAMRVSIPSFS